MARQGAQTPSSEGPLRPGPSGSTYDFHGLYRVRVAHRGLDSLMRRELSPFLTSANDTDLTVQEGSVPWPTNVLPDHYRYDGSAFVFQTESGRIAIREGEILAEPRVNAVELLGAWVENLMKPAIVRRGACFIHASAVSRDGAAILFPAWMGTGKTHLLLYALAHGYDYMADDWCFVTESGEALGYPRWPTLVYHHFKAYPLLREALAGESGGPDLRRRLRVSDFADSLRPSGFVSRRFHKFLADRFFVLVQAGPTDIVPQAKCVLRSAVSRVALLVSTDGPDLRIRRIPADEAAWRAVLSGAFERSRHDAHRLAMAYAGRNVPVGDTIKAETELLTRAFQAARCFEVTLPESPRPSDLDRLLSEIG